MSNNGRDKKNWIEIKCETERDNENSTKIKRQRLEGRVLIVEGKCRNRY